KKSTIDIGVIFGSLDTPSANGETVNNSFKIASVEQGYKFLTGGLSISNYFNAVTHGGKAIGERETATIEFNEDETELWLTVTKGDNMQIVWTGYENGVTSKPNVDWDLTGYNWRRTDHTNPIDPIQFLDGDYVIFDNSGRDGDPVVIMLDGTNTSVSGMKVVSGKYIFVGERNDSVLNSTEFTSLALDAVEQEVLNVVGGSVQMNLETKFTGGVTLSGGTIVIGHNEAFGKTSDFANKGIDKSGQIRVTENASIGAAGNEFVFNNGVPDFTVQNSITVANGKVLQIYVPDENVLTITNNAWSAIELGENARLQTAGGGKLSFVGNGSDADIVFGGAIYAKNHSHLGEFGETINDTALMDFSGLNGVGDSLVSASFVGNKASLAGGAIYTDGHLQIDGTLYFENNSADYGGAIASADKKNIKLKGSAAFISNSATFGGAIYGYNVKIADGSLFDGNTAADYGGAIFADGDLTIKGNTAFIYNSANVGGAIFMSGKGTTAAKNVSLNLNTNDGNIVFAFNESGGSEAIYLNDATTITVSGKNNVYFGGYDNYSETYVRDGIGVKKTNASGKGSNLIVRNNGFVQFAGDSILSYSSQTNDLGYIAVESGSLRVIDNVTLTTAGKVQLQGGTLAGGGTIVAGSGFDITSGRLSADSYCYVIPALTNGVAETMPVNNRVGKLTLDGNAVINAVTLDVDLDYGNRSDIIEITGHVLFVQEGAGLSSVNIASTWKNGTFDIMTAAGGGLDNYANYITQITFGGNPLGERQHAELSSNGNTLQLKTTAEGIGVVWTGAADPERDTCMDWNTTSANWKEYDNNKGTNFSGTDYVYFTGNASGEITVKGEFVEVGGMSITNGRYWFTGGEIHGVDYANAAYQEGVLKMYNGEVKFDTTAKFERDITVSGGSVTITTKGKLESTDGNVNFGRNSGLTFELSDLVEYVTPNPDTSSPITGITNYKPAEQHTYIDAKRVTIDGKVSIVNVPNGQQYYSYMYPVGDTIASPTHGLTPEPIVFKDVIVSDTPLDMNSLAQAFNSSDGLFGQFVTFDDGNKYTMNLNYGFITLTEFAAVNQTSFNKAQAAAALDNGFADGEFNELRDELYRMTSNAQVDAILDEQRGAEIAADVMYMAMTKPWREAFHRLSQGRIAYSNAFTADYRGQWYSRSNREFWFAGVHRTLDSKRDDNAREFGYSRTGAAVGVDWQFDAYTEAGIMFGYSEPRLYSPFGKVESYDYSLGIYGRRYLYDNWYFNGYLGVATQKHRYRRQANSALYYSDYYGNGLYASTEFYRPVQCSLFTFLPGFALDFQSVYADGFTEKNNVDAVYGQKISSTDLGQLMVRFGLNGKWNPHEMISVDTRLQYAFQVMGDTYSSVTSRLLSSPTSSMSLRGVDMGGDVFNMGFGVKMYLTQRRNAYLTFNYDQDYGVRFVSHSVDLSLTTRW
ncbi:MAG: autotransporter domain-containing protein, partial [Planctomycetaceae bacterium]|nr:autotransporter domain-containing protein [Planctomycetaceae bacterium]